MATQYDETAILQLSSIFKAIATGNFSFQAEKPPGKGVIQGLIDQGNMALERLKELFNFFGFVKPEKLYIHQANLTFQLDEHFKIIDASLEALELLSCKETDILNIPFKNILESSSRNIWDELKTDISFNLKRLSLQLKFLKKDGGLVEAYCYLTKTLNNKYCITSFLPVLYVDVYEEFFLPYPKKIKKPGRKSIPHVLQRPSDLETVLSVVDYIKKNLETNLPPLSDLVQMFGSNTFSLKRDFRMYTGETPYKYHRNERLVKAKGRISAESSLEQIAFGLGFKSYPNFSSAFKKKHNMTPREYQNLLIKEEDN